LTVVHSKVIAAPREAAEAGGVQVPAAPFSSMVSFAAEAGMVSVKLTPPTVQAAATKVTIWPWPTAPELQPVMVPTVAVPEKVSRTTPEPSAANDVSLVSTTAWAAFAKPLAVMVEVKVFSPVKVCVDALRTSPPPGFTQVGAAPPLLCRTCPGAPAASRTVVSAPDW